MNLWTTQHDTKLFAPRHSECVRHDPANAFRPMVYLHGVNTQSRPPINSDSFSLARLAWENRCGHGGMCGMTQAGNKVRRRSSSRMIDRAVRRAKFNWKSTALLAIASTTPGRARELSHQPGDPILPAILAACAQNGRQTEKPPDGAVCPAGKSTCQGRATTEACRRRWHAVFHSRRAMGAVPVELRHAGLATTVVVE